MSQPSPHGLAQLLASLRDVESGHASLKKHKTPSFADGLLAASSSSSSIASLLDPTLKPPLKQSSHHSRPQPLTSHPSHSPTPPGNDEPHPLNRLSTLHQFTAASLHPAPRDPSSQSQASAAAQLVQEITSSSRLLSQQPASMPPHLQTFKRDFEAFYERRSQTFALPTLHQLSPRTKKRLSLLPAPSSDTSQAADKYIHSLKKLSPAVAYQNIRAVSTLSRVEAQRAHQPQQWEAALAQHRLASEHTYLAPVSLQDLGCAQEDLVGHSSEAFFTDLEAKRRLDDIKRSVSTRFVVDDDDSATTVISELREDGGESWGGGGASVVRGGSVSGGGSLLGSGGTAGGGRSVASYPYDQSDLRALLRGKKTKKPAAAAAAAAAAGAGPTGPADPADSSRGAAPAALQILTSTLNPTPTSTLAAPFLYTSITPTNEQGRPLYDSHGSLLPSALIDSYTPVLQRATEVNAQIQTRYRRLQHDLKAAHASMHHLQHAHKSLLDEMKIKVCLVISC